MATIHYPAPFELIHTQTHMHQHTHTLGIPFRMKGGPGPYGSPRNRLLRILMGLSYHQRPPAPTKTGELLLQHRNAGTVGDHCLHCVSGHRHCVQVRFVPYVSSLQPHTSRMLAAFSRKCCCVLLRCADAPGRPHLRRTLTYARVLRSGRFYGSLTWSCVGCLTPVPYFLP